ncbi:hypothetical protein [Neorhizobium sp. NCHU2750]|uniref:hypothetical protein n=1 Tax=Neorhizobium sp. NCHU2750 TaxID=1825976 RepID=UPI000E714354|nr:hypothetical protein NCHU2750_25190 [Neorhizobium sp. NCHU2750]
MANDRTARDAIEGGSGDVVGTTASGTKSAGKAHEAGRHPVAGPHAKDHLTDHDKTPGTGSLPAKDGAEVDTGPD